MSESPQSGEWVYVGDVLGDGRYPVDVLYTDAEGAGRRIAAVQVTFLELEQEDE